MTYLKTLVLAGTALAFTACGGGGSSSSTPVPVDPMTEREIIGIFYHYPAGMCESAEFQDYMIDHMANEGYTVTYFIGREESLDVSCATYDRANDFTEDRGCITVDLALIDPSFIENKTSCVVGVDVDVNSQASITEFKNIAPDIGSAIVNW